MKNATEFFSFETLSDLLLKSNSLNMSVQWYPLLTSLFDKKNVTYGEKYLQKFSPINHVLNVKELSDVGFNQFPIQTKKIF